MMLPLLISVPHSGLAVPPDVKRYCALTRQQIVDDSDEGAAEIYHGLRDHVAAFVTTPVARAIVDMNRAEDDRRPDGVVKTHTCWNVPVYREFPPPESIESLLDQHYRPYHRLLTKLAKSGVQLGVDCHTMVAKGPPIGPGPGVERPWICLSNGERTCPQEWIESLAACFSRALDHDVTINEPFKGGYIIQSHSSELPWIQLEMSRAPFMSNEEKHLRVLSALQDWCRSHAT
ncbi:MAG: N-formylglutamate amidohydrolase [Phycisphaerales bacterium]|nr:MAG: N-formylglutamate amidohydrolase [Phycisphaerales bacterium]